MTTLYEDIREECRERGLTESGGKCIYAKHYDCDKHECPVARQFNGKRPADLLTKRFNLEEQYEREMGHHA